jgi:hypothetical protein
LCGLTHQNARKKTDGKTTICHNIKKIPRSVEKKKLAKHRAEEEKEARKRKRIEAKEKKNKLLNLGEAYVAMIVTMPSMKNVFQNTIRSTFPFLKMEMNSSVTFVTK